MRRVYFVIVGLSKRFMAFFLLCSEKSKQTTKNRETPFVDDVVVTSCHAVQNIKKSKDAFFPFILCVFYQTIADASVFFH